MSSPQNLSAISAIVQEGDIDYEGPKRICYCGHIAPRWISWSTENPGMRFYSCPLFKTNNKCGFFEWHDQFIRGRARNVIIELRDNERKLAREVRRLRRENGCLRKVMGNTGFNSSLASADEIGESSSNMSYGQASIHVASNRRVTSNERIACPKKATMRVLCCCLMIVALCFIIVVVLSFV